MGGSLLNVMIEILDVAPNLLAASNFLTNLPGNVWVGLQVALGLGFVIFVHELGHFLAAKTFGVKCEKFYVGFDFPITIGPIKLPKSLGKFQWGETEYGIGILPLGGYVKMLGQDDDPRNAAEEAERSRNGEGPGAPLDPRSYQAKPVWQRMIIISAGVIMNVIFAVVLAAVAFFIGVPYTPATVGDAVAGGPAWEAGIKPGDHVVQVASMSAEDKSLRFEDMAMKIVMQGFRTKDAPVPLAVRRGEERVEYEIKPTNRFRDDKKIFLMGIREATVAKLSSKEPVGPFSLLESQKVDLQPNDQIVAVDGEPLTVDPAYGKALGAELTARFHAKWEQPVEITVLRSASAGKDSPASAGKSRSDKDSVAGQEVKVTLPPVPAKTFGFGFAIGPITSIQNGSPAAEQKVQVGDIIEAVDGAPVTDALKLPMLVARKNGSPVELTLSRTTKAEGSSEATKETVKVTLTAQGPVRFPAISEAGGVLALPGLGIAYSVPPIVSTVDPAAEKAVASVQPGDELVQFKIEATTEELAAFKERSFMVDTESNVIDNLRTVPTMFAAIQSLPENLKMRCYFKRGGETREIVLPLLYAKDWYAPQRGVVLTKLQDLQKTTELGTAIQLGLAETGRRLNDVFDFLKILVTGRASARGLAGPVGIASAAASEAAESPSRLLIFLTLLSANLAILNLLPIPALDGGHLVFLAAEAVMGKPVNEALQVRLTMLGVLCLLGLMAFAVINDLIRQFT